MRSRRCEGVVIKEVRGLNKNVRCDAKATLTRELPTASSGRPRKPKTFHYCAKCAAYWDRQQSLLSGVLGGLFDAALGSVT